MENNLYRIRFFFDAGSGICFWSGNDLAKSKFNNYPIENSELPIPENLHRKLDYLCSWYDTSIDWDYPPDPSPWSTEESIRFRKEVKETLKLVIIELGSEYKVINEYST